MPPEKESVRLADQVPIQDRKNYLEALYLMILADAGGIGFDKGWSTEAETNTAIADILDIFKTHADIWRIRNHNLPSWNVVDSKRTKGTTVDADVKNEKGWLRLAQEVEEAEFDIFAEIWKLAQITAEAEISSEDFFEIAMNFAKDSRLFKIIRNLTVQRPGGREKAIFPHIAEVTAGIDKFEEIAPLRKSGEISATQRRAEQRFVAVMHDIVNILLADNDWLQLHAHAAATFLYRFFVVKMNYEHEEAVRVVNVIGFHHLPEVTKISHQLTETGELLELQATNRVIDPQKAFKYYRQRPGGWEELGRLMRFCLVDVGSNEVFKAEHIAALLGIIEQIIINLDQKEDENIDMEAVQVLVDMQILAVAYLGLVDQIEIAEQSREKFEKIVNIITARADQTGMLLDKLSGNHLVASVFGRLLSYS